VSLLYAILSRIFRKLNLSANLLSPKLLKAYLEPCLEPSVVHTTGSFIGISTEKFPEPCPEPARQLSRDCLRNTDDMDELAMQFLGKLRKAKEVGYRPKSSSQ